MSRIVHETPFPVFNKSSAVLSRMDAVELGLTFHDLEVLKEHIATTWGINKEEIDIDTTSSDDEVYFRSRHLNRKVTVRKSQSPSSNRSVWTTISEGENDVDDEENNNPHRADLSSSNDSSFSPSYLAGLIFRDLEALKETVAIAWDIDKDELCPCKTYHKVFLVSLRRNRRVTAIKSTESDFCVWKIVCEEENDVDDQKSKKRRLAHNPAGATSEPPTNSSSSSSSSSSSTPSIPIPVIHDNLDNLVPETGLFLSSEQTPFFIDWIARVHDVVPSNLSSRTGFDLIEASTDPAPPLDAILLEVYSCCTFESFSESLSVAPASAVAAGIAASAASASLEVLSDSDSHESLSGTPTEFTPYWMIRFRPCPCGVCWLITYYGRVDQYEKELVRYDPDDYYDEDEPEDTVKCPCVLRANAAETVQMMRGEADTEQVRGEADTEQPTEVINNATPRVFEAENEGYTFTVTEEESEEEDD